MIKPNELRIGNLVLVTFEMEIKEVDLDLLEWPRYLEPIKLTEEWLLKLGFEKTSNFNEYLERKYWVKGNLVNGYFQWEFDGKILVEYNTVHQLQNLYFALTGEELKIKER